MSACPALLLSAPASGSGKTSLTAALARLHVRAGRRVRVFKCGPDFLDPQIHEAVTGAPCENLDLWLCGETDGARRLARAAGDADLILVEGVMGLFDGTPSSADIAEAFGLPVLAIIDAAAMAQTFAAVAHGLATFRPKLPCDMEPRSGEPPSPPPRGGGRGVGGLAFYGALANRVGGEGHAELLRASLPENIRWCGAVARDDAAALPERHLGLLPAAEIGGLMERLDRLADRLAQTPLAELPPAVAFAEPPAEPLPRRLAGHRIAVAKDAAFCFLHAANVELLRELGAELVFFSPLAGEALPEADAVWLPGGYPELYAERLAGRDDLKRVGRCPIPRFARDRHFAASCALWAGQLRRHAEAGRPLLAECGGMMSLFERLTDQQGRAHAMAGLLPGETVMRPRLAALGPQEVTLPEGVLRGHTFHHSECRTPLAPLARARTPDGRPGEAIYRIGRTTASYVHFYFPSDPEATARLFAHR